MAHPNENGAALVTVRAELGDRRLEAREADIWHLAGGQAAEFWTFLEDGEANDRFFG